MDNRQSGADGLIQGVGVGLRSLHYQTIVNDKPDIPWFEVLSDNYLGQGGLPLYNLDRVREDYPVVLHGVGMSLGSSDPLNQSYLKKLKKLSQHLEPAWISDHLCWSSIDGKYLNDLLPLPYTEEAIVHLVDRIQQVQDFFGQRILIENVSSYLSYTVSTLSEWEFITAVAEGADCYILLDVNNIYVSASNLGFNALEYLFGIPIQRVRQFHLAGYQNQGTHLLDTHGAAVHPSVWELYEAALQRFGPLPTLIEWDTDIPPFSVLQEEAKKADNLMKQVYANVV